jgi:pimeloyl-ACP methyl ester carboxylesterase
MISFTRKENRWRWRLSGALLGIAILAFIALRGCSRWMAHAVVEAPNAKVTLAEQSDGQRHQPLVPDGWHQFRIETGPPDASLSVLISPLAQLGADARLQPQGTILILHGLRDRKESQIGLANTLMTSGYHVVLIDLRGHGQSTGQWLTYGVIESQDLKHVLDVLERSGDLQRPIGVIGCSYGAAVALQLAAIDARIGAIVAIACFTSLPDIVPHYIRHYGLGWAVSQSQIECGMKLAGEIAGFDPCLASPLRAISTCPTPVLLVHGANDQHIPADHSRALHEAALDHSDLLIIDGADHVSIFNDRDHRISDAAIEWFGNFMR